MTELLLCVNIVVLLMLGAVNMALYIRVTRADREKKADEKVQDAMDEVGAVVEGFYATKSAWELCRKQQVEMPIIRAAYQVLYEGADPRQAVAQLLLRQRKAESEDAGWA